MMMDASFEYTVMNKFTYNDLWVMYSIVYFYNKNDQRIMMCKVMH
jgi:hypothetical protein